MHHISHTPFGRALRPSDLEHDPMRKAPLPASARDKWAVMRELTAARAAFAVSDRDLAVLNALISFHPHPTLAEGDSSIVFPSNRALSERTHGMAESTLRRHLAALVAAGLVIRHDSPNGKRYARRRRGGEETGGENCLQVAFGFDLRPLLLREGEIVQAAQAAREAEGRRRALREASVLILRDVAQLIDYGREVASANWEALSEAHAGLSRELRRKLGVTEMVDLYGRADALRDRVNTLVSKQKTENMSGNADESERHKQDSNKPLHESESSKEMEEAARVVSKDPSLEEPEDGGTRLPLWLVLQACPDAREYSPDPIRNWPELIARAEFIHPMMGISSLAWREATEFMGATNAAITVLAMLQRTSEIRNPGGYLRALTGKAANGSFSPGPMVMALMQARNGKAV